MRVVYSDLSYRYLIKPSLFDAFSIPKTRTLLYDFV